MTTLVRPFGAWERFFYRYNENNQVQFSVVVEFAVPFEETMVRAALDAVQRRYPVLSAHAEDRPGTRLGFYRAAEASPIPLRVVRHDRTDWQSAVTEELIQPLGGAGNPLIRAVLITDATTSTVVLTFDHTASDGISATLVIDSLVAALNGRQLNELPVAEPVEDVINRVVPTAQFDVPPVDPRMGIPAKIRPFDGTAPDIAAIELSGAETDRLVKRCRVEHTTVHAAILVAQSLVRAEELGENFVRVFSPINVRETVGVGEVYGLYIGGALNGVAVDGDVAFWDRARAVSAELAICRSAHAVAAVTARVQDSITIDAEAVDAEHFLTESLPSELLITNLGARDLTATGPIAPVAVWGPVVHEQFAGEYVTGIVTYRGRLRMVTCAYTPPGGFLAGMRALLMTECG
ncbi:peptide synthetase [Mycobacterium sp. LTG2003]